MKGGSATYSALGLESSSSDSLPSSSPAFLFFSFIGAGETVVCFGGYDACVVLARICTFCYNFLYRHLMNPLALVFEFIPNYYKAPPPNANPCSKIAIPSPVVTRSDSLNEINKIVYKLPIGFCSVTE